MSDAKLYTVFAATNEALREVYIGFTCKPMFEAIAELQADPPRQIAHWDFSDVHNFRSIEFDVPAVAVGALLSKCAKGRMPGWKSFCQPDPQRERVMPRSCANSGRLLNRDHALAEDRHFTGLPETARRQPPA